MITELAIIFSDNLKRIKDERGINQAEMAKHLSISQQALSKIERRPDGHCDPKLSTVAEVAKAFRMPGFAMLIKDVAAPDSSDMLELIEMFSGLTPGRRLAILGQMRYLDEITRFEKDLLGTVEKHGK